MVVVPVVVPETYKLAVSGQDQQLTWGNMIDRA